MLRFAANLSLMYQEYAFHERFAVAARDGFRGVEYMFPYAYPVQDLKALLDDNRLTQVMFNAPAGDWAAGERGMASLPGREAEFRESIATALAYARVLGNRQIHVMAGRIRPDQDRLHHRAVFLENLTYATQLAAADGVCILIEPINTRNFPGYFLTRQDEAQAICAESGAVNLKVQFDCYHCQIVEGDVAVKLRRDMARIGHIQIAGVPERHEPDRGELHYPYLLELIDRLGYAGWIGCEYIPAETTSEGLGWLHALAQRGATTLAG